MRPSLATDRLSCLLTYISFVVDHRWTFRSIIDIAIDSFAHWKTDILCESQRCPVFTTPSTSGSARMRDTLPYVLATWDFKTSQHRGVPPKLQGRIWDCNLTNDIISIYSLEDRYIFCERCRSDSTSQSDERWHSQRHWALAGRTTDVTGRMWPANPRE